MRLVAFIGLGWLGTLICSAWATRLAVAHVLPDMAVLVVVFLAMRRSALAVVVTALTLGYLRGRLALAPVGHSETSLVLCALGTYLATGHLAGSGAVFFALSTAGALTATHALEALLLVWQRGSAGFSSWATALLLPAALATGLLALVLHPFLVWLERRLTPDSRVGLLWR